MQIKIEPNLVFAKTAAGEEVVRQSTRVVQRNLRMILVQIDGKMSVADLCAKVGDSRLVEQALIGLEEDGLIAEVAVDPTLWQQGRKAALQIREAASSQFSTFGMRSRRPPGSVQEESLASAFSVFGKPVLPIPEAAPLKPEAPACDKVQYPPPEGPGRRMRIHWRSAMAGMAGLLLMASVLAVFYPYQRMKPQVEAVLGGALGTPAQVDKVEIRLLPWPMLMLADVRLGPDGVVRAAEIGIPTLSWLFGAPDRRLAEIRVWGFDGPAETLALLASGVRGWQIGKVVLNNASLRIGKDVAVSGLEGGIVPGAPAGKGRLSLRTADGALRITGTQAGNGVDVVLEGAAWRPEGGRLAIGTLQAKGRLEDGRLMLPEIEASLWGGALRGSGQLAWDANGLAMSGEGRLAHVSARQLAEFVLPGFRLEGDLSGPFSVQGAGPDGQSMWKDGDMRLEAEVTQGSLGGIDLGEAARRGQQGRSVTGGATRFERLEGVFSLTRERFSAASLNLDAGLASATGKLSIDREGRAEGAMEVSLNSSVRGLRVPVRITGRLPELTALAGR